jgi:hypothetical protein
MAKVPTLIRCLCLLGSALLLWQTPTHAAALELSFEYPGKPIPTGYATYTLFLIPDEEWASQAKQEELARLYDHFQRFGHAIGPTNLAVWFWKAKLEVDVSRSRKYCNQLGLAHRGPYVVTFAKHPDAMTKDDEFNVLNLNEKPSEKIGWILTYLAKSIADGNFTWNDDLNTGSRDPLTFPYPRRALFRTRIKSLADLGRVFTIINEYPLREKHLNNLILFVLFTTLTASTFLTIEKRRVRFRKQSPAKKGCIFFGALVGYYIIYQSIFLQLIADTAVILVLTAIYGLIPQQITQTVPALVQQMAGAITKKGPSPGVPGGT